MEGGLLQEERRVPRENSKLGKYTDKFFFLWQTKLTIKGTKILRGGMKRGAQHLTENSWKSGLPAVLGRIISVIFLFLMGRIIKESERQKKKVKEGT